MTISLLLVSFGNYSFAQTQQDCIDDADRMLSTINLSQTVDEHLTLFVTVEDNYAECLEKIGISENEWDTFYGHTSLQGKIIDDALSDCDFDSVTQNINNQQKIEEAEKRCNVQYVKMVREANQNNRLKAELMTTSSDTLVVLETSQGKIVIEFFIEDAPNHVRNFMNLTESGFYDGVTRKSLIKKFCQF